MRFFLLLALITFIQCKKPSAQIQVRRDMIINLNGVSGKDLWGCFDNDTNTKIDFTGGINDGFMSLPFSSYIVLDSLYDIREVQYYVTNNSGGILTMQCYDANRNTVGEPLSLSTKNVYKQWMKLQAGHKPVRFIEITGRTYADINDGIMEIRIFGRALGPAASIYPKETIRPARDIGIYANGVNIIGDRINAKDASQENILKKLAKSVRFYWEGTVFDYFPDTYRKPLTQSPLWLGRFGDDHAKKLLDALNAFDIRPMMSKSGGSIKWLGEKEAAENNAWLGGSAAQAKKYIEPGANPETDTAWKGLAEQYFKLIALYGANPNAKLDPASVRGGTATTGQATMDIFEWDNEPNRFWGADYYHSPLAYYEALRSVYARGKQADPNARIFAGALPGMDTTYWKALFFIHYLRTGNRSPFPADGFNFNHYLNNAKAGQRTGTYGISPEQYALYDVLLKLKSFFGHHFPNMPVQWTEFGYATDPGSPYHVNPLGKKTAREVQADWTLRLKAITQCTGFISRMYNYAFFEDGTTAFSTMGLVSDVHGAKSEYKYSELRPVGYALANELAIESGYPFFARLLKNGDSSGTWVTMKTGKTDTSAQLYKIWMGTSKGAEDKNYTLRVPGAVSARMYTVNYTGFAPKAADIKISNGIIVIPVSESMSWVEVRLSSPGTPPGSAGRSRRKHTE